MSPGLFEWTRMAALSAMLLVAMWQDTAVRRIPNPIVLRGAIAALALAWSPHGIGLGSAIAGGLVGFLGFLSLYLLRLLGAGDVKLAGATGLYIGGPDMVLVCLKILIMGGILSFLWAWRTNQLRNVSGHLKTRLHRFWPSGQSLPHTEEAQMPLSTTRVPYAIAIAAGTAVHLLPRYVSF